MLPVIGFDAKVLDINFQHVAAHINIVGGKFLGDVLMRRYIYEVSPGDQSKRIELSDIGSEVVLRVEQISGSARDGASEHEIVVTDFENTHKMLSTLEFTVKAYQENRRSSWLLKNVLVEIDTWPMLPSYLRIAGKDEVAVNRTAKLLGFRKNKLVDESIETVYLGYGIDMNAVADLRFRD